MERTRWYKKAFIYQIYPFSFMDSNNDGMGDMKGIIEKLDHIKELGINAIWFSPLYDSPNKDYGYDIRDYYKISEKFGTFDDFKNLINECHKRDIKVIMDMVINHTSNEHEWFKNAISSKDSKYRDYYIIKEGKRRGKKILPPNNWHSTFTGKAWERIGDTDDFYLHIFAKEQPDLNWENPKVREEIAKILNYYLDLGVDGFRFDVFNLFSKVQSFKNDNSLFDIPKGKKYFVDGPRIHEFLKELYSRTLKNYDSYSVGESYTPSEENAIKYVSEKEEEFDTLFNFAHLSSDSLFGLKYIKKKFNFFEYKNGLFEPQRKYFDVGWNTLVLENHDVPRSVSRFGLNIKDYHYYASTMLALSTFSGFGTPFIYEGEESGLTNTNFNSIDEMMDPVSHFIYDLFKKIPISKKARMRNLSYGARDQARVPMAWDDTVNGGFNTGFTPWQSVNTNYKEHNVKKDKESEKSVFKFYQKLIELKKTDDCLIYGKTIELFHKNKKIISYKRVYEDKEYFILSSFKDKTVKVKLPAEYQNKYLKVILSNYEDKIIKDSMITLRPYEAVIFDVLDYKDERSYGAVLYKIVDGKPLFLVEHMVLGHYALPKGHIEENERITECIKREIKEELNLEVNLKLEHSHKVTYSPYEGIMKDVVYFIATPINDDIIPDNTEVLSASYYTYEEAYNLLTYDNDKEVLKDLRKYIEK